MDLFGLSVPQILGLFFVGYVLLNALSFFLTWLIQCLACGFHDLLSKLSPSSSSSPPLCNMPASRASPAPDLVHSNGNMHNNNAAAVSSSLCCCDCSCFNSCSASGISGSSPVCSDYQSNTAIASIADALEKGG